MIGLATAITKRYEHIAIPNFQRLVGEFGWEHPIEIWEAGEEISAEGRAALEAIPGVKFRNTLELDDRVGFWRGFQIKAPAVLHSEATHLLWCDADVRLYKSPAHLLETDGYKTTGSYIFHDFPDWKFSSLVEEATDKFHSIPYFLQRKRFLRALLPVKSVDFPAVWDYIYADDIPTRPVQEAFAETAVFALDREANRDVAQTFYNLNYHHNYTYRRFHGDKELLWISFLVHGKPFTMNPAMPVWEGWKPLQTFCGERFYV